MSGWISQSQSTTVGDELKLQSRILQECPNLTRSHSSWITWRLSWWSLTKIFPFEVNAFLRRRWRQSCLQRYRSRSLRFVGSSLADICLVSSYCLNFLALHRMWNFVPTDLRRAIIWRGPFLLELGLPTLWELIMSSGSGFIPAVDVASCVFPLRLSNARKTYERAPSILLQFVQLLSEVVIAGWSLSIRAWRGAIFSSIIFENSSLSESFTASLTASAIFLKSSVETPMGATT